MAAQNGVLYARGVKTGALYMVEIYLPDAVATRLTFNYGGGLAGTGSDPFWQVPTNEDVVVVDYSIATAPTAVGMFFTINGGNVNGTNCRHASFLTSVVTRPGIGLRVPANSRLGATQY